MRRARKYMSLLLMAALLMGSLPAAAEGEVNIQFEKLCGRYGITADGDAYDLLSDTGAPEYMWSNVEDIQEWGGYQCYVDPNAEPMRKTRAVLFRDGTMEADVPFSTEEPDEYYRGSYEMRHFRMENIERVRVSNSYLIAVDQNKLGWCIGEYQDLVANEPVMIEDYCSNPSQCKGYNYLTGPLFCTEVGALAGVSTDPSKPQDNNHMIFEVVAQGENTPHYVKRGGAHDPEFYGGYKPYLLSVRQSNVQWIPDIYYLKDGKMYSPSSVPLLSPTIGIDNIKKMAQGIVQYAYAKDKEDLSEPQTDELWNTYYNAVLRNDGTVWEWMEFSPNMDFTKIPELEAEEFVLKEENSQQYEVKNPYFQSINLFGAPVQIQGISNVKDISIAETNILLMLQEDGNVIRWQSGEQAVTGMNTNNRRTLDTCTQTLRFYSEKEYDQNQYMYVDGYRREIDPEQHQGVEISDERMLIPMRAFVEACGGTAEWDESQQKATLKLYGTTVEMYVNKIGMYKNGELILMDTVPQIKNGRVMIPIRFAAEAFGFEVRYSNYSVGVADLVRRVVNLNS